MEQQRKPYASRSCDLLAVKEVGSLGEPLLRNRSKVGRLDLKTDVEKFSCLLQITLTIASFRGFDQASD